MSPEEIIKLLKAEISSETGIALDEIDDDASFFSLGLDSVSCVFVLDRVEKKLKVELNPMFFWDYPTVATFGAFLSTMTP